MKNQYLIFRNTKCEINEVSSNLEFNFNPYSMDVKDYSLKLVVKESKLILENLTVETSNHQYPKIDGKACIQTGTHGAKTYVLNQLYDYTGDIFIGRELHLNEPMIKPWKRYDVLVHLKFSDGKLVYVHELVGEEDIYHYYEMVLLRKKEIEKLK